ncbi:MAG: hypothetical protein GX611_07395 [Clostridiales bacterium]|nr:hypothetical protein [Clostridiales bacterium]
MRAAAVQPRDEVPPEDSLKALARQALRDLILAGRLSPGDLIKVITLEEEGGQAAALPQHFVIQVMEDSP